MQNTQDDHRVLRRVGRFQVGSPSLRQVRGLPLFDEAERIAHRIYERSFDEADKMNPRRVKRERRSARSRKRGTPRWLKGER